MFEITRCKHGIDLCREQCQLCDPLGSIGNPSPSKLNIDGMQAEIERLTREVTRWEKQADHADDECVRLSSEGGRKDMEISHYRAGLGFIADMALAHGDDEIETLACSTRKRFDPVPAGTR